MSRLYPWSTGSLDHEKSDPLATWADLALAVKGLYTEDSSGAACPGLIEANPSRGYPG